MMNVYDAKAMDEVIGEMRSVDTETLKVASVSLNSMAGRSQLPSDTHGLIAIGRLVFLVAYESALGAGEQQREQVFEELRRLDKEHLQSLATKLTQVAALTAKLDTRQANLMLLCAKVAHVIANEDRYVC